MANDLSTPLSGRRRRARAGRGRWHFPLARLLFGLVALLGLGIGLRLVLVDDPDGGRPAEEVAIAALQKGNAVASNVAAEPATITADPQQYPADGAMLAVPPPGTAVALGQVPDAFGALPDLSEETANGPIPRISGAGETPFAAYKRPPPAGIGEGEPRIALVVSGLGINEQGSLDAIDQLPDAVTLGFAPYGRALATTVQMARSRGHEVMLELPLEPFDYPQNDPGPHTLLTGETPRANLEKLFWLMARFGGYFGVLNNMGARFSAAAADFGPVMEEVGARGLGYLDDGSSNRSVAGQLAGANKVPFARASMLVDANPSREAIATALEALEAEARETGAAIGIVSALPISIKAVAEWAGTLDGRGVALVPVSALMK